MAKKISSNNSAQEKDRKNANKIIHNKLNKQQNRKKPNKKQIDQTLEDSFPASDPPAF